jgi:hypothetical protein
MKFSYFKQNLKPQINWDIIESPIFDATGEEIRHFKAINRNDNGRLLNICKKSYTPSSNGYFTDKVNEIAEFTGFKLDGYEERKEGKQIVAYLENPEVIQIAEEQHANFIVLGNSHDGSTSFFSGSGNIMFRCGNGLTVATAQAMKVLHRKNSKNRIDELANHYRKFKEETQKTKEIIESFEYIKMNEKQKQDFTYNLLNTPKELEYADFSPQRQKQINLLSKSIELETDYFGNNLLGVFQGVTHYTSNVREIQTPSFLNVLGSNADINRRALNLSLELLNN